MFGRKKKKKDRKPQSSPRDRKPRLLWMVERLRASPSEIRVRVDDITDSKSRKWRGDVHGPEFHRAVAEDIIKAYARRCAAVGAATSAVGIVPGLGSLVGVVGLTVVDLAMCLKLQVDLVAALAHHYDRDIDDAEEQRFHLALAGMGVASQLGVVAAEELSVLGLKKVAKRVVGDGAAKWLWKLFAMIAKHFLGTTVTKVIPLGVGAAVSWFANREIAKFVGRRARDYFAADVRWEDVEDDEIEPEVLSPEPEDKPEIYEVPPTVEVGVSIALEPQEGSSDSQEPSVVIDDLVTDDEAETDESGNQADDEVETADTSDVENDTGSEPVEDDEEGDTDDDIEDAPEADEDEEESPDDQDSQGDEDDEPTLQ